jgi:hypothetical protein
VSEQDKKQPEIMDNHRKALEHAIQVDDADTLRQLIDAGADADQYDLFGYTPLMLAAQLGAVKCTEALLAAGVDPFKKDRSPYSRKTAIAHTSSLPVARLLAAAGNDINDLDTESDIRAQLLGLQPQEHIAVGKQEYHRLKQRVFGTANPERSANPLWQHAVRNRASAWKLRQQFDDTDPGQDGAVWCYARFGTALSDLGAGEFIEIGGEHEDHYDPDFCIYNDVIHYKGDGTFDIYQYPQDVFPPTDFHTATRVGEWIYIIGGLGYPAQRRHGTTPVYRLSLRDFHIEPVITQGDCPGWIYHHKTFVTGESTLRINGGEILTRHENADVHQYSTHDFELCLKTLTWTRHPPQPLTRMPEFFAEEYKRFRHSEGSQLAVEQAGGWTLCKIIAVRAVEVRRGEVIHLEGEAVTLPVDDYLLLVFCAWGGAFAGFDALQRAVQKGGVAAAFDGRARLTTDAMLDGRWLGFGEVTKEERILVEEWLRQAGVSGIVVG